MFRHYLISLVLTVVGAAVLGALWATLEFVLADGEFVWAYAAIGLGIVTVAFIALLGRTFAILERDAHR